MTHILSSKGFNNLFAYFLYEEVKFIEENGLYWNFSNKINNIWTSKIKHHIVKSDIDIENECLFSSEEIKSKYSISKISFFEFRNYLEKFQSIRKINTKISILENGYALDFIVLFLSLINHFITSLKSIPICIRYESIGITHLEKDLMSFYGYDYNTVIDKTTAYNTIFLKNKLTIGHLLECSPNNKYKTLYFS